MAELQRGLVKWFNDAKGFGFIEHPSGRDVFVHYSVIDWDGFKTLKDGEEVDYELSEGDKGLHASKVVRTVALKKKLDKETAEGSANGELVAPNLESGSVNTEVKTAASMIEVEKQGEENAAETATAEQDSEEKDSLPL